MEVNFTLVVQALNFFIAYIMIRKLLLVPVVRIITKQEEHHNLVQETIAQLEESIAKAKRSRRRLWENTRAYFSQKSPLVGDQDLHIFKGITPEVEVVTVDQQEKQALINRATDVVTNVIVDK